VATPTKSRTKPRTKPNANPIQSATAYESNAVRLYGPDSPQAQAARIESITLRAEEAIRRLVAQAPPLPEENRRRIAAVLLNPAGGER
jgi:hypothetical protein